MKKSEQATGWAHADCAHWRVHRRVELRRTGRQGGLQALLAIALTAALVPTASAHVVLVQKVAPAGSYYRAQFMVGHGCEGASTVSVQVDIPEGIPVVRPQPKAGWQLHHETAPLAEPVMVHGKPKTEAIRKVIWSGGSLADQNYDEFGMLLYLATPGILYFRVLQTCERGANDWAEVPVEGVRQRLAFPAAVLHVIDPAAHHGHPGGHHQPGEAVRPGAESGPAPVDAAPHAHH